MTASKKKRAPRGSSYDDLVSEMPFGFSLNEMIFDKAGSPSDYRFLEANPAFETLTGLRRKDILGKRVREIAPDIEPFWIETFGRVVKTGKPASFDHRAKNSNRHYEVRAYRPRKGLFAAIFTEISGRKQAEELLSKTARALRVLSMGCQAVALASDEENLLERVCRVLVGPGEYRMAWIGFPENDRKKSVRHAAWAGMERGYLEGLKLTWADSPRGRGPTGTAIRTRKHAIARDIPADPRFKPWRKSALERGYASSIALPLLEGKRVLGALNIYAAERNAFGDDEVRLLRRLAESLAFGITNLRARREAQRGVDALRESEQKFKDLAEQSPSMIFINHRGRVVYANPRCEEVMGYTRDEFYSADFNFMVLIAPESQDSVRASLAKHRSGEDIPPKEYAILTKDGRRIDAIHATKLIPYKGERAILGILTDVTERNAAQRERELHLTREKELRKAAEEANRAKDEFLALLSHELRTPMTAMMGWLWLLRNKDMGTGEAAQALDTIERNMSHQAQIIEDLLDTSRIVTGKLRLESRPVELGPLILASVDVIRPAAAARFIELRLPAELPELTVLGDPGRLQQVFWNLLSNAVKFTPEGGSVAVTLEKIDGRATAEIKDTGCGIDPHFLGRVFDPFSQAEAALTRDHGGLGLGLALVHRIVELHGGSVRARSDGLSKGSAFSVALPLAKAVPSGAEAPLCLASPGLKDAGPSGAEAPLCPASPGLRDAGPKTRPAGPLADLSGIGVLVVDDERDTVSMLKATLELCGARVSAAVTAAEAFKIFEETKPDVLILDLAMPGEDGFSLIRRIRGLGPKKGGSIPAAALTALTRAEDRTKALRSGFQTFLHKPVEPAELAAAVRSLADLKA